MTIEIHTERRQGERRSTTDQATTRERVILDALYVVLDADPDGPMVPGLKLAVDTIHAAIAIGVNAR